MRKLLALTAVTFVISGTSTAQAISESAQLKSKITKMIVNTHYRQAIMGQQAIPTKYKYKARKKLFFVRRDFRWWSARAGNIYRQFVNPPRKPSWLCIHRYEGSWSDTGDPYWGGLQMDRGFMRTYAPLVLLRRGFANNWSPLEQIWVAERAFRSGRGFYPWPNTARYCGLI